MHTTSHSQSSFLTSVNGRMCSHQILNGTWSGTWTGPRPVRVMALGFIDGAQEGSIASALVSKSLYSRLKYMPLRHV